MEFKDRIPADGKEGLKIIQRLSNDGETVIESFNAKIIHNDSAIEEGTEIKAELFQGIYNYSSEAIELSQAASNQSTEALTKANTAIADSGAAVTTASTANANANTAKYDATIARAASESASLHASNASAIVQNLEFRANNGEFKGNSGVLVSTSGMFGFVVNENGHLILCYEGSNAPNITLNSMTGHLIYNY